MNNAPKHSKELYIILTDFTYIKFTRVVDSHNDFMENVKQVCMNSMLQSLLYLLSG